MPGKLIGSHKLEAFGYRIGIQKGEYAAEMEALGLDPWAQWSVRMQDYCEVDVEVTERLYKLCAAKPYHPDALALEFEARDIVGEMERNGFPFRAQEAAQLYAAVVGERDTLEHTLGSLFPPWYTPKRERDQEKMDDWAKRHDGKARAFFKPAVQTPKRSMLMHAEVQQITVGKKVKKVKVGGVQYTAGAPFTPVALTTFNPSSDVHIADRLIRLRGWEPDRFTDSGLPQLDDEILSSLQYPEAAPLSRFKLLQKRAAQISEGKEGWLQVSREGIIYGAVDTLGAVTRRASHFKPNIAQVPKVGSYFGAECRALFWAGPDMVLVGADLAGIELRMLAHYMARYDGGAYAEAVVNGSSALGTDVHSINARALGLDPKALYTVAGKQATGRDLAKTFIYAFLYGAGAAKLAKILGRSEAQGAKIKAEFLKGLPALAKLIEAVANAAASGFLRGLDGGLIPVRSKHAALNTLLQGAGAIVSKQWLVTCRRRYRAAGWTSQVDYWLRAWVHDETQTSTRTDIADAFGQQTVAAIADAGIILKLRVPITGEYKVGVTWKDTH
jgi:DNA polymerase I-like protein with 3'-5' exonuclease and polymerase domains